MDYSLLHSRKKTPKKLSIKTFMPLLLALTLGACVGCSDDKGKSKDSGDVVAQDLAQKPYMFEQTKNQISVMAYNVENLFDTLHDPDREDFAYLPLANKNNLKHREWCKDNNSYKPYLDQCLYLDWSESVVNVKMASIAKAILQVNSGLGPDVLILEEVENLNILKQLNERYLSAAGYTTIVLIEGPDKRGIDIGLLSRLPATHQSLSRIPFVADIDKNTRYSEKDKNTAEKREALTKQEQAKMNRSRGILRVDLTLPDGENLAVFGVHFPSPSNPAYWRTQAYEHLQTLRAELPEGTLAIAGGDFNITRAEDKELKRYENDISETWLVSHRIGCFTCLGTSYYHRFRDWSFLDVLLFDPEMDAQGESSWKVIASSIATPNQTKEQMSQYDNPLRFDAKKLVGTSDHWPIYSLIEKR